MNELAARALAHGRAAPPADDGPVGPLCPICSADKPHNVEPNTGKAGGWLCRNCSFLFDGGDREALHPRTQQRRDMWTEETRSRTTTPPPTTTREVS